MPFSPKQRVEAIKEAIGVLCLPERETLPTPRSMIFRTVPERESTRWQTGCLRKLLEKGFVHRSGGHFYLIPNQNYEVCVAGLGALSQDEDALFELATKGTLPEGHQIGEPEGYPEPVSDGYGEGSLDPAQNLQLIRVLLAPTPEELEQCREVVGEGGFQDRLGQIQSLLEQTLQAVQQNTSSIRDLLEALGGPPALKIADKSPSENPFDD